jgi:hypothetical protein
MAGNTGVMGREAYGSLLRCDRRVEMEVRALSGSLRLDGRQAGSYV